MVTVSSSVESFTNSNTSSLPHLFFFLFSVWIDAIMNNSTSPFSIVGVITSSITSEDDLIDSLEKASRSLFKRFKDNLFKGNPDKCHLLVSTNEKTKNKYRRISIENSDCEKLFGVKIAISLICAKKLIGKSMH